jgi:hypothetical protein
MSVAGAAIKMPLTLPLSVIAKFAIVVLLNANVKY